MTTTSSYLQTGHLTADLKGRSARGGAVTMVTQGCKFLLTTSATMVLARLLTPRDYGLVGMVTAVIGFASVFKDLGLSSATIQRAEISHQQVSNLFWLNVTVGGVISLLVAALAPSVAWFYHEPRLRAIGLASASLYLLGGLTTQHQALLQRQMRFVAVATVDISALIIGLGTGIGLAWVGAGYWALVYMSIAQALAAMIGAWLACRWQPGWISRKTGVRELVAFGGNITVVDFLSYITRNLDNVLIGWRWGPQPLALYAKAYQMLMMPLVQINAPVRGVTIPALSRLQNDPGQFRTFYLKALSLVSLVTLPMILLFILLSEEIVLVVLGPQWGGVGSIFRWLGVAALPQPMMNTAGWLYVTSGQTARMMRWASVSAFAIITSFVIGLPWGAQGVAISFMVTEILLAWPMMWYATRGTAVSISDVFRVSGRMALASAVAVLPCAGLKLWLGTRLPPWELILVSLVIAAAVYGWFIIGVLKMKDYYASVLTHFRKPGGPTH